MLCVNILRWEKKMPENCSIRQHHKHFLSAIHHGKISYHNLRYSAEDAQTASLHKNKINIFSPVLRIFSFVVPATSSWRKKMSLSSVYYVSSLHKQHYLLISNEETEEKKLLKREWDKIVDKFVWDWFKSSWLLA